MNLTQMILEDARRKDVGELAIAAIRLAEADVAARAATKRQSEDPGTDAMLRLAEALEEKAAARKRYEELRKHWGV